MDGRRCFELSQLALLMLCAAGATAVCAAREEQPSSLEAAGTHSSILASYTGEAADNPIGGIREGAAYAGRISLDAHFALGIESGEVRMMLTSRHGQELSQTRIGNNTSVQELYGLQKSSLALVTYSQVSSDGRFKVELGRTAANFEWLNSPLYCQFQNNSVCPAPTFVFKTSNLTYFPAGSWGTHAKAWVTDRTYLHAGVYEVNPELKTARADGLDWSTRSSTGVMVPFEVGYSTSFVNDPLPRQYRVGGWYDAATYSDPAQDDSGQLAVLSGRPLAARRGRSGAFLLFEQMIRRPDPEAERGLRLFGAVLTRVSGRTTEDWFAEIGLVQTGTFVGRDHDTLGLVINEQQLSSPVLESIETARVAVGGNANIAHRELTLELTYGVQLGAHVRVSPNLQLILDPDQQSEPFRTRNIPNAWVIGLKFTIAVKRSGTPSGHADISRAWPKRAGRNADEPLERATE